MRAFFTALVLLAWSLPAAAGGTGSPARIIDFIRVSDSLTTFTIEFLEPFYGLKEETMERCPKIKVWAKYDPGRWPWQMSWSQSGTVTQQTYADAVEVLEKAYAEGREILFGTIGTGLRERSSACNFDTRGLVARTDAYNPEVMAFHDSYEAGPPFPR
jgi:hypothetical protein